MYEECTTSDDGERIGGMPKYILKLEMLLFGERCEWCVCTMPTTELPLNNGEDSETVHCVEWGKVARKVELYTYLLVVPGHLSLSCGLDVFSLVFFFFPLLRLLRPICMSDRSANNTCSECELRGLVLICGATVTISKLESANRLPQRFASVDLNFSSSPAQCLSMLSLPLSYQFRQCALSFFYYRVK